MHFFQFDFTLLPLFPCLYALERFYRASIWRLFKHADIVLFIWTHADDASLMSSFWLMLLDFSHNFLVHSCWVGPLVLGRERWADVILLVIPLLFKPLLGVLCLGFSFSFFICACAGTVADGWARTDTSSFNFPANVTKMYQKAAEATATTRVVRVVMPFRFATFKEQLLSLSPPEEKNAWAVGAE